MCAVMLMKVLAPIHPDLETLNLKAPWARNPGFQNTAATSTGRPWRKCLNQRSMIELRAIILASLRSGQCMVRQRTVLTLLSYLKSPPDVMWDIQVTLNRGVMVLYSGMLPLVVEASVTGYPSHGNAS